MAERDYSGVATASLATFIKERVPENHEAWAEEVGIDKRTLRRIFTEDYQWTGLAVADRATSAFDLLVDEAFDVIPGATAHCSKKMARDELEVIAESWGLPSPTPEEIDQRAEELEQLRIQVLGPPTQAQLDRLAADTQRTKNRMARNKNGVQTAEFKVF